MGVSTALVLSNLPLLALLGVSNGPIQFKSARKIWCLLELLAKITRVLACFARKIFATARMLAFSLTCAQLLKISLTLLCSYFLYIYKR